MLWIKAFHIITVITWFAAIFYLPRLFVYHSLANDNVSNERFKIMERRLYYGIMMPSFLLTLLLGLWLLFEYGLQYFETSFWLQSKLFLVTLLIVYHFYCGHIVKLFKFDNNNHSDKFYRILNELPVFLLVCIIILAVVKPF